MLNGCLLGLLKKWSDCTFYPVHRPPLSPLPLALAHSPIRSTSKAQIRPPLFPISYVCYPPPPRHTYGPHPSSMLPTCVTLICCVCLCWYLCCPFSYSSLLCFWGCRCHNGSDIFLRSFPNKIREIRQVLQKQIKWAERGGDEKSRK